MSDAQKPDGQLFDGGDRGVPYHVYDINGWGVSTGATFVVWVDDESLE